MECRQLSDYWFGILFFKPKPYAQEWIWWYYSQMKQYHIHIHVYIYMYVDGDFFQNQDWNFSVEMLYAAC